MAKLPKLKVTNWVDGTPNEDVRDFEQARDLLFDFGVTVLVDGRRIASYEQLLRLAAEDSYKDREFLEVELIRQIVGG